MPLEFPYQLVAFLDKDPAIGEPVYTGANGWYPQLALKRRFKIVGIGEDELQETIKEHWKTHGPLRIHTGALVKPERMPVRVIEITHSDELMTFHRGFISLMAGHMESRYPDRDGENYLPHITAEYDQKPVIDAAKYIDRAFTITTIYLLRDIDAEDTQAYQRFTLYT